MQDYYIKELGACPICKDRVILQKRKNHAFRVYCLNCGYRTNWSNKQTAILNHVKLQRRMQKNENKPKLD